MQTNPTALARRLRLIKNGWAMFVSEYGSVVSVSIGLILLVTAASLTAPPWWLAVAGWIPIVLYLAKRVGALPGDDPRQSATVVAVISFFLFGGFGMSSAVALFRALLRPSLDNFIGFGISRGFLASTIIYFAMMYIGYQQLFEKAQHELSECRSALEIVRQSNQERVDTSASDERGKARVREAERRLKEYKWRLMRGRYLRKLRESAAHSPNGSRGSDGDKE